MITKSTHARTQKRSLLGTGVLQVVNAVDQATQPQPSHNQPSHDNAPAAPPTTDTASVTPQPDQPNTLANTASLLPQLRESLTEVGLTLPWPRHPPATSSRAPAAEPPLRDHEASSAPDTHAMLQHMAQLQRQGTALVQPCSIAEPNATKSPSAAAITSSTSAMSADTQHTQRRRNRTPQRSMSKRSSESAAAAAQLHVALDARLARMQKLQKQGQALLAKS